jgi:uncharacterized protein YegL
MNDERVVERAAVEQGQLVIPFYLLCDVSSSMNGIMPELNDAVGRLRRAIVAEPVVDDVAQICVISFSDTAKVLVPMASMSESEIPRLTAEGGTNYGSVFRLLAHSIMDDTAMFKRNGYKVYRPCAFFLTDGEPTDSDWRTTFTDTLTYNAQTGRGLKAHPIFVPLGFRDAPADVLRQLAYPPNRGKWYHAKNATAESALHGMLHFIMQTVIIAGHSAAAGEPKVTLPLPEAGSGIVQGDSEYDSDYI